MDIHEYLLAANDFVEKEYLKTLEEIERDFGVPLKKVMNKGKKFRPMLTLLCCEAVGGTNRRLSTSPSPWS